MTGRPSPRRSRPMVARWRRPQMGRTARVAEVSVGRRTSVDRALQALANACLRHTQTRTDRTRRLAPAQATVRTMTGPCNFRNWSPKLGNWMVVTPHGDGSARRRPTVEVAEWATVTSVSAAPRWRGLSVASWRARLRSRRAESTRFSPPAAWSRRRAMEALANVTRTTARAPSPPRSRQGCLWRRASRSWREGTASRSRRCGPPLTRPSPLAGDRRQEPPPSSSTYEFSPKRRSTAVPLRRRLG
mmetsp:Transcript_28269/g.78047  ORF Transcript_28269/g.78047 Transcript_28269/m.78047 type:complete len:245 (+) Transcript_28269:299-1033(+)